MKKSKIPVPITIQKTSKLCNEGEKSQIKSNFQKKQVLDFNKTTKIHSVQKKTIKTTGSHPGKSKKLDSHQNPNVKNKLVSSISNKKCNIAIANKKTFDKDIKLNDRSKSVTSKTKTKQVGNVIKTNINPYKKKLTPSIEPEMKSSSTEDTKENLPSPICYSFEEEVCTPVGNTFASNKDCFENENVEFEANEIYRKMILSNTVLSPSVRKLLPNLRLSSLQSERPSVYKKLQIPNDPLQEALKALENTCLSAQRIKKENNLMQSPRKETFRDSIYTPRGDPNKEFLKKLESFKLKQLQKTIPNSTEKVIIKPKIHGIKTENNLMHSPRKETFRDSIYTARGDPNEEFLKKLESFKLKQLQKTVPRSTKKVTFNLQVQECTPKNNCDVQHNLIKDSEHKLMQINEKSEENKDGEFTSNISGKHEHMPNQTVIVDEKANSTKVDHINVNYPENNQRNVADETIIVPKINQKMIKPTMHDMSVYQNRETSLQKEISCGNSSPVFVFDNKNIGKYTNFLKDNNMQPSPQKIIKQSAKVYTPKPISLSSKSKIYDESYSPEFLCDRKSVIMTNLAPICTPLVLKSQAKNIMFSPETDNGPILLKWDFTEEDKDSPKKQTCRRHSLLTLDNIVTIQKQLDDLADQECLLSLINENFPVICGRYLTNPVARTLIEGDDMHFIPIQL